MKTLSVLLLTIPLVVKLVWDYNAFKADKKINHPQRYLIIGAGMVVLSLLMWMISPAKYFIQPFFLSASIFFFFFDPAINLLENRQWYFIPEVTDERASWTDRKIYAPLGWKKLLIGRAVILFLAVVFNFWMFQNTK